MSGMYGNSRRSRTRSPVDDYLKRSLLAKVNKSELKLLRVAIKRGDGIGGGGPHLPLERSIDDPLRICPYVHYRKDEDKKPKPPIFGRGIKVNQDFTENRRVFTHETTRAKKSRSRSKRRSRSRSSTRNRRRSRSASRNKRSRSLSRNRSRSHKRSRNKHLRSRSRERSRSKSKNQRSRSRSRYQSRSRERRYSSDRRKHKDNDRYRSSQRSRYSRSRSSSRSLSPHEHKPDCPLYEDRKKKSLTPLRPGEYRPGHPDLALRSKRNSNRSRSRSYDGASRSRRSQSLENLPSTSRDRSTPERHYDRSKSSRKYQSPIKGDKRERQSKSRSYPDYYKIPRHSGPHEEYGFFEGWVPGPRMPTGRGGGFAIQPYYPPPFHPRGMMPGQLMHPGLQMMPRMPIMGPYGPYRPHLPIYNSGAVRQRGPRPDKPATTAISEQKEDDSNVVITEETSQNGDESENCLPRSEHKDNENDERKEEQIDEAKE